MSKYVIDSSTLTSIADAVRTKGGTTDPIVVSDIPTAITNLPSGGGEGLTAEDLTFSGDLGDHFCNGQIGNVLISKYKNLFSFNNISSCRYFCNGIDSTTDLSNWTINIASDANFSYFFHGFEGKVLPNITCSGPLKNTTIQSSLASMYYVRNIPSSFDNLDFSLINNGSSWMESLFKTNYSMRSYSSNLIKKIYNNNNTQNGAYRYCFYNNFSLDEVLNMPISCKESIASKNLFVNTIDDCSRLKNFTFELNGDSPYAVKWKSQTININNYVGYSSISYNAYILNFNSGITADKEVKDDDSYQALKNDPDWFTADVAYSRYNHDSAVRTINSLPDTSAYLASAGGTNTIKFKGAAGEKTDGGAINTLTEEEIAVAAAKGWTVTLV